MEQEIVIAGISGRFPEASNIDEFWGNLRNGVDMVTVNDRRWSPGFAGLPPRRGTLKNPLDEFDAGVFSIHRKQADRLDPGLRQLLEVTWEAVFDSGVNPVELRSHSIGVYVGNSSYESMDAARSSLDHVTSYDAIGSGGSMFANRLSFAFDFRGPSFTLDTYCSSSLLALHLATKAILHGECEGAIVAGVNIHVNPLACVSMNMLGVFSPDGKCKAFDASGDGYAQSEAVAALYITKRPLAKRCYATVLNTGTNTDGHKENGLMYPSGDAQTLLMRRTYAEAVIRPEDVYYVEPHGTGTAAGDVQELQAITSVFCENRPITAGPLLIGSTKSNMGHAETASGLCSIIKVLLSIQHGQIPANLHYTTPNPQVPALLDGRLKVVDRLIDVTGDLFGVCATGVGGANVHVILRGQRRLAENLKIKYFPHFPLLIPISARTSEGIDWFLKKNLGEGLDLDAVQLLARIHELPIPHHVFRSYALFNADTKASIVCKKMEANRPLWVVIPGMGTQWAGMGRDIMQIDPIRRSLEVSASILTPFDLNLIDLVTNEDEEGLRPFAPVAMAAVGIALIDFLKSLGLVPEGYIGHSVGDILCGYLDGCWTQKEVILGQYYKASLLNELKGDCGMAAVGLTWDEAVSQCPEGIYPACHNAEDNVTLSGREFDLVKFVQALKFRGVFAKMVPSGGVAYHSPYISHLVNRLEPLITDIMKGPRVKSPKWVSTAIVEDPLNKTGKCVTPEYFLHQFVSPVRFNSALKTIPANAVVLELGSHSLFQPILKRSLPASVTLIPTMQRNAADNVWRLFSAVGSLYVNGFQPKISALSPEFENNSSLAPNSKCSISSLVQWDHSKKYLLFDFVHKAKVQHVTKVSLLDKEWAFLSGHKVDGQILFPATGYLVLVWKALASLVGKSWRSLGLKFENVILHRTTVLKDESVVEFAVSILENSGSFEIVEAEMVVASGEVEIVENFLTNHNSETRTSNDVLKSEDLYKDFRLRGYKYTGDFQGILSSSLLGDYATVRWTQESIVLLDTIMQIGTLSLPISASRIYLPTRITRIVISPGAFEDLKTTGNLPVYFCSKTKSISTTGVQILNIHFNSVPRREREAAHPAVLSWALVPYIDADMNESLSFDDILKANVDIVLENITSKTLSVTELCAKEKESSILHKIDEILKLTPDKVVSAAAQKTQLLILQNLTNFDEFQIATSTLDENGFILIILTTQISELEILRTISHHFGLLLLIATKIAPTAFFYLLRKPAFNLSPEVIIPVDNTKFDWIEPLQEAIAKGSLTSRIWLTSNDPHSGLVGFVNCLRKEGVHSVRCLISPHPEVTEELKDSDLVMNVFSGGKLCSYRGFNLPEISKTPSAHAYLNVLNKGDLNSVHWIEAAVLESFNKTKINVHYAALNFRDIMLATGKLSPDALPEHSLRDECVFGVEYSGIDPQGNHVMGIVHSKGLSTYVQGDPDFMWSVPANWTLAEASTVPVAYATAYYALMMRGNLQRGESVFITSGSGGVGQAAIAIALSLNCKIYTTVGSYEKKVWLAKTFPQIHEEQILSSQNTEFASEILNFTSHRGVDVVLNSLAEEKLKAALSVVTNGGRFLEIGKFDMSQNTQLGMEIFLNNIAFHGVFVDNLFFGSEQIIVQKQKLKILVQEGIESGVVRPLPISIFESAQAREAFRFMASGKHMGKVVLRMCSDHDSTPMLRVIPCTYFDSQKTYILVGGLGGFGLEITAWLISRGVRSVALVGRRGVTSGYQQLQISRWRGSGVNVKVSNASLQNPKDCESFLQECESCASVGGIFHLALVLKDSIFENQNAEYFHSAVTPKYTITQTLDQASRKLCPRLDHFVVFSSAVATYGNAGQSNYAFGGSAMEQLIAHRRFNGFPALSIAFGPIDDVGYYHETGGGARVFANVLPQPLTSCLNLLGNLLHPSFQSDSGLVSSLLFATKDEQESVSQKEEARTSLTQKMAEMLGLSVAELESKHDTSMRDLGMDSLMVLEAKQILAEFGKVEGLTLAKIRSLTWDCIQKYEMAL